MKNIEFERIVNSLTVWDIDAGNKGHVSWHRNQSDSDLKYRIKDEHTTAASCFVGDEERMMKFIKATLGHHEEKVLEWVNDDGIGADLVLRLSFGKFKNLPGKAFFNSRWHDWKQGPIPCDTVVIVLRKVERRYDTTFQIRTAYCDLSQKAKNNLISMVTKGAA